MKHSINKIIGYSIGATDGELGKVSDFYFDDHTWTLRYLVVETGGWLLGRKVLISPEALVKGEWTDDILPVNLTKEQVKTSPEIDTDKPVSRQHEQELYTHYAWPDYWSGSLWGGGIGTTGMMMGTFSPLDQTVQDRVGREAAGQKGDPHLRSAHNVKGYNILSTDGTIGDVEDYIIDDSSWKIDFIVVDTRSWIPGKKILLSPKWIKEVSWEMSSVTVNLSTESVKNSPAFDSIENLSSEYESSLNKHYGYNP